MKLKTVLAILSLTVASAAAAVAQCQAPVIPASNLPYMFSEEQERQLGEVITPSILQSLQVVEEDELAAPLNRVANALARTVPASTTKFRVVIIDEPLANAFTFPGGTIYVTRKAITLARDEDEIAGLLAHEMGHQLTRQFARTYGEIWRIVLHVNTVGDRESIEDQYHTVMDTIARDSKALKNIGKESDRDQMSADQVSLSLTARAGYRPAAFVEYFDRIADNHRGTSSGNWFGDMLGFTEANPNAKRFRQMAMASVTVPPECIQKPARMTSEEFARWREKVTRYSGFGKKESLPEGSRKLPLKDALRAPIRHLRFSPDGKYVLAQDEASIFVLSRDPFKALFRIDAEDGQNAQFTPDSKNIVFYTDPGLRVEKWNIEQQQRTDLNELVVVRGCWQTVLSPTGEYLACVHSNGSDLKLQLSVLKVDTGEAIYEKRNVYYRNLHYYWRTGRKYTEALEFSPNGRYLLGQTDNDVAYDLQTSSVVNLTKLRKYTDEKFTWLSNDTIFGHQGTSETSDIVKFPSGELLKENLPFSQPDVTPSTKGSILLLRPIVHAAVGLFDQKQNKIIMASKVSAIDVYDDLVVSERRDGEVALYRVSAPNTVLAAAELPRGPAASLASVSVSPGLKYVAYSDHLRGAVWALDDGTRKQYVRGFIGSHFFNDQEMFAAFPPEDSYVSRGYFNKQDYENRENKKWIAEQIAKPGTSVGMFATDTYRSAAITSFAKRFSAWQHGPYLMVHELLNEDGNAVKENVLEVRDMRTGNPLWSRKFKKEVPQSYYNVPGNSLVFLWKLEDEEAKELLKADAGLREKVSNIEKAKKSAVLVQLMDHATGKTKAVIPIDTGEGSFGITDVDAVGDTVVFTDTQGRVLIYDSAGRRKGRLFGSRPMLDGTGKLLVIRTEPGRVAVYDLTSMKRMYVVTLGSRVRYADLTSGGDRLVLLSADQTVYVVPIKEAAKTQAAVK